MMRCVTCVLLVAFLVCALFTSCSKEITGTSMKKAPSVGVSIGTIHNQFVREYLGRERSLRPNATLHEKALLYVETAQYVCKQEHYDFAPTQDLMNECLSMFAEWKETGIWDVFMPFSKSPVQVVEQFANAGIIPKEDVPYLISLISELCQGEAKIEPSELSCAPSSRLEPARDLLASSCTLWYEQELVVSTEDDSSDTRAIYPIIPYIPRDFDHFWKKLSYYSAVGLADGLAGWGSAVATGGNPFVTAFATGFSSAAAKDWMEEHGLKP